MTLIYIFQFLVLKVAFEESAWHKFSFGISADILCLFTWKQKILFVLFYNKYHVGADKASKQIENFALLVHKNILIFLLKINESSGYE